MTYEIRTAEGGQPIIINNDAEMQKIESQWKSYKKGFTPDTPLKIKGKQLLLSLISNIERIKTQEETRAHNREVYLNQMSREQREERQRILGYSMEKRARMMQYFRLFYFAHTYIKSEEVAGLEDKVYDIQFKYFTENPEEILCNAELYKPLLS